MNKFTKSYGIDISKDVFDMFDSSGHHRQFSNDPAGFKEFKGVVDQGCCCVMEVLDDLTAKLHGNGSEFDFMFFL